MNRDIPGFPAGHAGELDLIDDGRQKVRCSNPSRGPHWHATDNLHEHANGPFRA